MNKKDTGTYLFSPDLKMRKVNPGIFVSACILFITLSSPVDADTYYVSPPQSIQQAIDDANDGDQIEVAPGTYFEAVDFKGKAVRLYSSDGPEVTTIDANGLDASVVTCTSGEDANTVIQGFTITAGTGTTRARPGLEYGGGMYNVNSSPAVKDCNFTKNSVAGDGGGMYNDGANPRLVNCTFTANSAALKGGGMSNFNSSPTVTNSTFTGSSAGHVGGGFEIKVTDAAMPGQGCGFQFERVGDVFRLRHEKVPSG